MKIRPGFRAGLSASLLILSLPRLAMPTQANHQSLSETTTSLLGGVDASVVNEFRKVWKLSGGGIDEFEYLILLHRRPDGSIFAEPKGRSKETKEFRFAWNPSAIAVVHTHPNSEDAKPSPNDLNIADHFKVPMFTITRRGMYVYDPFTRKIVEVQEGLNWLKLSKWQVLEASLMKSH